MMLRKKENNTIIQYSWHNIHWYALPLPKSFELKNRDTWLISSAWQPRPRSADGWPRTVNCQLWKRTYAIQVLMHIRIERKTIAKITDCNIASPVTRWSKFARSDPSSETWILKRQWMAITADELLRQTAITRSTLGWRYISIRRLWKTTNLINQPIFSNVLFQTRLKSSNLSRD